MEHRSQKAGYTVALALALVRLSAGADLSYPVRHVRPIHDHEYVVRTTPSRGTLVIGDSSVTYKQTRPGKKKLESVSLDYVDIQELWIAPDRLVVVTYRDRRWALGLDQRFEFQLAGEGSFQSAYEQLKTKLDRRLVAALADPPSAIEWQLPVKLLGAIQGSEGTLLFGADRIVYKTGRPRNSRSWRYQDIENVSTSDPYQFSLTTYEHDRQSYGSMKAFNFQLKQPLDNKRFETLWKRLNRDKGLQFLTAVEEGK